MPAPKKPTKQPPRKKPVSKKPAVAKEQDNVVAKPVALAGVYARYLDKVVAEMLKDREQRFEAMVFRYLENAVNIYSGIDLDVLNKRGHIVIGKNDKRTFFWDDKPVVEMPEAHIKYE